jgi:exopolysaccharide biosynthesis polyprenyl glycosylphosphotransferase
VTETALDDVDAGTGGSGPVGADSALNGAEPGDARATGAESAATPDGASTEDGTSGADPEATVRVPMQRFRARLAGATGGRLGTSGGPASAGTNGHADATSTRGSAFDVFGAAGLLGSAPDEVLLPPPPPAQLNGTTNLFSPRQASFGARGDTGHAASALEGGREYGPHQPYRAQIKWERDYARLVVLGDFAACLIAAGIAYLVRFGGFFSFDLMPISATPYIAISAVLPVAWVLSMSLNRAYESRFLGGGSEEFRRVVNAAARLTALVAVVSYATKAEVARAYLLIAFPTATLLTLAARAAARSILHRMRGQGRCLHRVLVVGAGEAAASLVRMARRNPNIGWSVVGICLDRSPGRHSHDRPDRAGFDLLGVPVVGTSDALEDAIRLTAATTVAISPQMDGERLRRALWALEGSDVDVLVSSAVTDVTGPRIHLRPVAGLPLLHIEEPELSGARRFMKAMLDRSMAVAVLLLLSPLLLALGLAVRLTSRGPAIFRQTRVGRDGRPFTMFKFRSMYVDAEARLADLTESNERAEGLLFKMKEDPRITRAGKFLRKWSLDELPQMFNILNGSMSLVGPRPPLPREVAEYEVDVHRRLMVKPGLTGLWQVSGRSDLEWDESVRLDLRYVENWSLALDLIILWRTVFAVLKREGAY